MSWEVTGKSPEIDVANGLTCGMLNAAFGLRDEYRYTVENSETGEEKQVVARDESELGSKIASGDFEDDD